MEKVTVTKLIEQAEEAASHHILKKGTATTILDNGDAIACSISYASSRHSGSSWGKVNFYLLKDGCKKYSKFSKTKAIDVLGL